MEYFSDKQRGPQPRIEEEISPNAWGGIVTNIKSLISNGAFGNSFPEMCADGHGPTGTDEQAFVLALKAEIPGIQWPLQTTVDVEKGFLSEEVPYAPNTLLILDLIQFCHVHVAEPITQGRYHDFLRHYHLTFDASAGQEKFREKINRIFARNGLAYELEQGGNIVRLAPPVLRELMSDISFHTGDSTLDNMLEEGREKFLSPDVKIRHEGLERLWDAWERIKTLEDPNDKKQSISKLLDKASFEQNFRTILEEEAKKLTEIGNTFHIRHSEVGKPQITSSAHVDYLFHRLFGMIQLLLRAKAGHV